MLEVAGDNFFGGVDDDGNVSFPSWYARFVRIVVAHASLRLVLYMMIHKCFHISLDKIFGGEIGTTNGNEA